ncbi:MAG: hypothetical protein R2706_06370 [Acidimicrobiales bacterium]
MNTLPTADLTEAEAAEKLADAEARVAERVTMTREEAQAAHQAELADALGMTVEELEAAKADGTSIRDLAEAAGVELPGRGGPGGPGGHGGPGGPGGPDHDGAADSVTEGADA